MTIHKEQVRYKPNTNPAQALAHTDTNHPTLVAWEQIIHDDSPLSHPNYNQQNKTEVNQNKMEMDCNGGQVNAR
jgi:hypothetical protein